MRKAGLLPPKPEAKVEEEKGEGIIDTEHEESRLSSNLAMLFAESSSSGVCMWHPCIV